LDDGDLLGDLRQQTYRPVDHVVQVDRAVQQGLDRSLLRR
jgi:hypothetical protein